MFISSKISELGRDIWHTYLSISRFNSIFDKFPVLDELLSSPLVSELKRKRHSKKSSASQSLQMLQMLQSAYLRRFLLIALWKLVERIRMLLLYAKPNYRSRCCRRSYLSFLCSWYIYSNSKEL